MRILVALSLVFYTANGFRFSNVFSNHEEIAPLASCTGVATGTRLPHETECGKFILCDSGMGLTLSCRATEPHFNRCTSTCVNDASVCGLASCPGDTTTTGTTTTSTTTSGTTTSTTTGTTTTSSTTTTTGSTAAPVTTTTTTARTTTPFNPPTVPLQCAPACDPADCDPAVTCPEQVVCKPGNKCECDATIKCPMPIATCSKPEGEGGCGCEANCKCSDPLTELLCSCAGDVSVCTFDRETQCVEKCGCDQRCDSSVCEESKTTPGKYLCTGCNEDKSCPFKKEECLAKCGCTKNCDCDLTGSVCNCFATCQCTPPPDVCPFVPSSCVTTCGCAERCNCNGPFCMCNPDGVCP